MNANQAAKLLKKIEELGFRAFIFKTSYGYFAVSVSAKHGDGAADYYGEFSGGYPWINPKLEQLAKARKSYWEWQHPGAIAIYD